MTKAYQDNLILYKNNSGKVVLRLKNDLKLEEFTPTQKDVLVVKACYTQPFLNTTYFVLQESEPFVKMRKSALGVKSLINCSIAFMKKLG